MQARYCGFLHGCEVICQGVLNHLASSLRPCFVEASPTMEKAVSCYKACQLIVSLPSFCSVQSLLAVREFRAAEEEHCEQGHNKCVRTFDGWCRGAQSASDQLQVCELNGPTFGFTMQEFSMVGDYTEDLKKPQNCQNWGVGTCAGMGTIHTCVSSVKMTCLSLPEDFWCVSLKSQATWEERNCLVSTACACAAISIKL